MRLCSIAHGLSVAGAALVVMVGSGLAQADYVASFDSDVEGWQTGEGTMTWQNSAGSDDSIGWARGDRTGAAAYAYAGRSASGGAFTCNVAESVHLESMYGTNIDVTWWMKDLDGSGNSPVTLALEIQDGNWGYWAYECPNALPTTGEWTKFTAHIDTNWTNDEAIAAGWTRWSTVKDFRYATLRNSGMVFYNNGTSGNGAYGIDSIRIGEPVPEPGTMVLGLMASLGLLAYAWRRRR